MNTWKAYASGDVCERRNFIFDKVQKRTIVYSRRQSNQQMDENMNMALGVELIIKRKYEDLQLGGDGVFQLTQQKHVSRYGLVTVKKKKSKDLVQTHYFMDEETETQRNTRFVQSCPSNK